MMLKLLFIILLIMCFVGAEMKQAGIEQEDFEGVMNNVTYDKLMINSSIIKEENNINNTFLQRSLYKLYDFMSFVTIEGSKEAIEYGYENPQYNFELAWKLLFISIFAGVIIPLMYIIIFIVYFIIMLRDWIKNKKVKEIEKNRK